MRISKILSRAASLVLIGATFVHAQTAPADLTLSTFVSGISAPIAVRASNDNSGRVFVVQQNGTIRVYANSGASLGTYISVPVTNSGEQGMLGMAFDPNFGVNPGLPGYGDFYLAFTSPTPNPTISAFPEQLIRRYTVSDPSANSAASATAVDVIRLPDPYSNHNGGDIHFGPDGYLYYAMGDGGSGGDPNGFAQDLWKKTFNSRSYYLLGKMMRLDVRNPTMSAAANQCGATAGQPAQYSIPPGNPYSADAGKCAEIWLYGLRNPFRFSFDRVTGDVWIGDVGQQAFEEIDFRAAGSTETLNYGWKMCEGLHGYPTAGAATCPTTTGTAAPVIEQNHLNNRCAITGGYRFRGPIQPFNGMYVHADACSSEIYFAKPASGGAWTTTQWRDDPNGYGTYSGFGEDQYGNLYLVHTANGIVYRFTSDVIFPTGFD